MTIESNNAGKPECNCSMPTDSCVLCIDLTIINPNVTESAQKTEFEICHDDEKVFHIIDKGFKVIPVLGDGSSIEIFGSKEKSSISKRIPNSKSKKGDQGTEKTRNGAALKVGNTSDKPYKVNIDILGRCRLEPEKCPEGLLYTHDFEDS